MPKQDWNTQPGHPYNPNVGTGIEWLPKEAKLWNGGEVIATAKHKTSSAFEFWRTLAFAEAFPKVTHWWFRSNWTGNVRCSSPMDNEFAAGDAPTAWGTLQFINDAIPAGIWTVTAGNPPIIDTPHPPNQEFNGNLPLRLVLAHIVTEIAMASDAVRPGVWIPVTSLVPTADLENIFPEVDLSYTLTGLPAGAPVRRWLCAALNLPAPTPEVG